MSLSKNKKKRETPAKQNVQFQKMETVRQLARGVAHDFNNFLMVIGGYSKLLLKHLPPQDENHQRAEHINNTVQRASALTHQLLIFGRNHTIHLQDLNLNAFIVQKEEKLRQLVGENIKIVKDCNQTLWLVRADPIYLEQVLINLVSNARDAMPEEGCLRLKTKNLEIKNSKDPLYRGVRKGCYGMLSVCDNGSGMSAEICARIFEPFFTTKPSGKGSGLGLLIASNIIHEFGGYILVASEKGKGSTFEILLPKSN